MKRQSPGSLGSRPPFKKTCGASFPCSILDVLTAGNLSDIAEFLTRPPFRSNPYRRVAPLLCFFYNKRFPLYKDLDTPVQISVDESDSSKRHEGWLTPHSLRDLFAWRTSCKKLALAFENISFISKLDVSRSFRPGFWPSSIEEQLRVMGEFKNLEEISFQYDIPLLQKSDTLNDAWGDFLSSMVHLRKIDLTTNFETPSACIAFRDQWNATASSTLTSKKPVSCSFCNPAVRKRISDREADQQRALPEHERSSFKGFFQRIESIKFESANVHFPSFISLFPNLLQLCVEAPNPLQCREEFSPWASAHADLFAGFSKLENLSIPGNVLNFHPGVAHHLGCLRTLNISKYSVCREHDRDYFSDFSFFKKPLVETFPFLEELVLDGAFCSIEQYSIYEEIKKLAHLPTLKRLSIADTEDVDFFPDLASSEKGGGSGCLRFFSCAATLIALNVRNSKVERSWLAKDLISCALLEELVLSLGETYLERQLDVLIEALPGLRNLRAIQIWIEDDDDSFNVDINSPQIGQLFRVISEHPTINNVHFRTPQQNLGNQALRSIRSAEKKMNVTASF